MVHNNISLNKGFPTLTEQTSTIESVPTDPESNSTTATGALDAASLKESLNALDLLWRALANG